MSTENHNGSAPHANGNLKTSTIGSNSSITSINSTTSSRTLPNNSSFLYSSNSTLNRDKPRQVPPPTLPKYTSSFNAGNTTNGTNGITNDKINRDREIGGSYRLASLDRLALRQRILDGEKASSNGDATNSVRNIITK